MAESSDTEKKKVKCKYCNKEYINIDSHIKKSAECQKAKEMEELHTSTEPKTNAESIPVVGNKPRIKRKIYISELDFTNIDVFKTGDTDFKNWLKKKDIIRTQQLACCYVDDLKDYKAFKDKDEKFERIYEVMKVANDEIGNKQIISAIEIKADDYQVIRIGVTGIDNLLGGGFRTGDSYEIFGEGATGKTQILLQLIVRMQLPLDKYGLYDPSESMRPQALWIDSENTLKGILQFNPAVGMSRIEQVAMYQYMKEYPQPEKTIDNYEEVWEKYKKDMNEFVFECRKNLIVAFPNTAEQQVAATKKAFWEMDTHNYRLIIVDSIIKHFRAEYMGISTLSPRQQLLNNHLHHLTNLSSNDGLLVVANQVTQTIGMFSTKIGAGGNITSHNLNNRCQLKKAKAFIFKLIDSSWLKTGDTTFDIDETGISSITKEASE